MISQTCAIMTAREAMGPPAQVNRPLTAAYRAQLAGAETLPQASPPPPPPPPPRQHARRARRRRQGMFMLPVTRL